MSLFSWGKNLISNSFSHQKVKLKKIKNQHHLDKHLVSSLNKQKFPSLKQLKHLPKILDKKEKNQFSFLSIIIFLSLILLCYQLYLVFTIPIPKSGGEYIEGLIGSPTFINPILVQSDADRDLARLIFSGLLKYDKNRNLIPDLAKSYEISEDQLTYTFHLRDDVNWHDGERFKADDVIFTIAAIQNPDFKSPFSRSFRGIQAEKIDDNTIKINLQEPFAPFLGLLIFGILPEHLWYSIPPANADLAELNKRPIGTGAWKFESFKKDSLGAIKSYTLVKNQNYYNEKPYLNKLIFKFYGDFISAIDALKSKKIEGIAYLPKEYEADLEKHKHINYHRLDQPQYTAIFFNQQKNELLAADYIREVLALATDKQQIILEAFNQGGRIINEPSLPGIEPSADIKKYEYNSEKATDILIKNEWQLVSTTTDEGLTQQVMKKKDWFLEINLTTVDQPENIKTSEIIKKSWEQIGIKTNLIIVDKSKIVSDVIKPRNYEALFFGQNLGSDPDPFSFWHSSQNEYPGLNLAIFKNKDVDELLEKARKTNNWEERKVYYLEFQKIITEELPAIFLYNPIYTYPQSKEINGFDLISIATPADRFDNLNQWYTKTKRIWK